MKILLSSIAKNDIRMLMRVFNAEKENNDKFFLDVLKDSVQQIVENSEHIDIKNREMQVFKTDSLPVNIHYIIEDNDSLLITAVFKN
ncbi:hypothetical protein [Chryseobacterium caseinilyticum]|uniref:Type II toxin-antitoxin system RelE/ParE family toxin n=1 Tax=Chryseobacterium caseinilyticum TaxID=2771428 RepID=A0ABR8ZFU7_9FLAO|nr:hypothetical protein [Chryseobacterium caseinilyticum]MBD8084158.1 hypothetical protein [Chryseobacterium caseinilyticum]